MKCNHIIRSYDLLSFHSTLNKGDYETVVSSVQSQLEEAEKSCLLATSDELDNALLLSLEAAVLRLQSVVGHFHFDLYKVRCRLLSAYLMQGMYKSIGELILVILTISRICFYKTRKLRKSAQRL